MQIDTNLFGDNIARNFTVQLLITLVHIQPRPQMFKQLYTMMKTDCKLEEVLRNHIDAEI